MLPRSFVPSSVYLRSKHLRQDLSRRFQIPAWFWGERYQRSNGSFGCDDVYDNDMQAHTPAHTPRKLFTAICIVTTEGCIVTTEGLFVT
jgi:hypothetical protein